MKLFKKMMTFVLAAIMTVALGATSVFAEDTTIKVDSPVDGHAYKAYQLFVGDVSDGDNGNKILSNVKWGSDVITDEITYVVDGKSKTVTPSANTAVPQDFLAYVAALDDNQATANMIGGWVSDEGGTVITATATKVATGYYVVKDSYVNPDSDAPQTTTLSTYICQVVDVTAVTPKAGSTEHHKYVLDVNDTNEAAIDLTKLKDVDTAKWVKSADHDFGDKVPFKLITKIGSDFAKYSNYYLAVNDTLGTGLGLNSDSIEVYVDGKPATKGTADGNYSVSIDGQSFKIEFNKLNAATGAAADKDVIVYYTATLKDSAVIGNPGNPNTSFAEFSNNPNGNQEGKGKTPEDTVVVFTYKTDVDKVDPNGAPLSGAGFTLYKKYNAAVAGKTNVAGTTPAGAKADTFPSEEFWYVVKTISAGDTNTFAFEGIDDGTYKLVESTTPTNYNTIDPITLNVIAQHGSDENSPTKYSISSLSSGNENFKADAKGGTVTFNKKDGTPKILTTGQIYSEIVNQKGTELPSTGGIGTTIFYVLGGLLVVGAGIVLVARKNAAE